MKKIFFFGCVLLSINGFTQKINNKLNFQKGQKLEMVSNVSSTISQEMMGQSIDTKVTATLTRVFDVEDVSVAGASIEHKVKRVQMEMSSPIGGSQSFDSEKEEDKKSSTGKSVEKSMKNKYKMMVDATGKITSVKADDDNSNKSAKGDDETDMMAGMFSKVMEGLEIPQQGDKSDFKILPDKELTKGDTWTDSTNIGLGTFTIADINDTTIVITYTEIGNTQSKQEMMGQEINISAKLTSTGKIILDRKTGLLKENTSTIDSKGAMEMMGQSIPINTKTMKTTIVKAS